MKFYMLDVNGAVVQAKDVHEWGGWMASKSRLYHQHDQVGEALVSTVFIGVNTGLNSGTPVVFETMIFGGEYDRQRMRHRYLSDARTMHKEVVKRLKAGLPPWHG